MLPAHTLVTITQTVRGFQLRNSDGGTQYPKPVTSSTQPTRPTTSTTMSRESHLSRQSRESRHPWPSHRSEFPSRAPSGSEDADAPRHKAHNIATMTTPTTISV